MQDFMKGRKRWLGVLIWAAFIVALILRIGTGSYLAEIDAQHWEATRPKAETTLTEEEIAALEQEVYNQEAVASILSLVALGFGLAGLYFVNRNIAQRSAFALGTVFIVTLVTFVILRAMPGDPFHQRATELVQQRQMDYDDALRIAYREFDYDPDKPFLEGFLEYVGKVLRFDLGLSWQYKIPVNDVITEALPWTLLVLASSLAIGFTVGSVLGMVIAWKRRTALDPLITFYSAVMGAMPPYIMALVLLITLGVNRRLFPISGGYDATLEVGFNWPYISSVIHHTILPVLSYTFVQIASWALAMKGNAISVLGEDYITAARARGLKDRRIILSYVGRNAMLPMITLLVIQLGTMLAATTLVEGIYNYPGIGRFNAQALSRRDYGMMQGLFLFQAIAVVFANFMADVAYTRLDPRIKLEE